MLPYFQQGGFGRVLQASGGGGGGTTTTMTWNPADKTSGMTLDESDLRWNSSASVNDYVRATVGKSAGKWYWEIQPADPGDAIHGIKRGDVAINGTSTIQGWRQNGQLFAFTVGSAPSTLASFTTGDVLMFAMDVDAGNLFCGKNGTWQNSGNPAAGTGATHTGWGAGTWHTAGWGTNGGVRRARILATMTYTPPTGFSVIN